MHSGYATQLTLGFGGFLGQDVAFERLAAFDAATCTDLEALFCATPYVREVRCFPAGMLCYLNPLIGATKMQLLLFCWR